MHWGHMVMSTCVLFIKSQCQQHLILQATRDKEKLAQSKVTKRPTFKRPAAKLSGPPIPADDEPAQPTKRARLDTHLQQNEALASKPRVSVHPPNADVADHPQAWSPTQHANLPYSPGECLCCLSTAELPNTCISCLKRQASIT